MRLSIPSSSLLTRPCSAWCIALALLAGNSPALAVLGQVQIQAPVPPTGTAPGTSPAGASPTAARAAAVVPGPGSLYSARDSVLATGTVVTEYATPAGLVFALTWQGPVLPDLDALLGSYFGTFRAQADASRARRSLGTPLRIESGGLVLQSRGRMGNFSGYAYAPTLVPDGVRIDNVLP